MNSKVISALCFGVAAGVLVNHSAWAATLEAGDRVSWMIKVAFLVSAGVFFALDAITNAIKTAGRPQTPEELERLGGHAGSGHPTSHG